MWKSYSRKCWNIKVRSWLLKKSQEMCKVIKNYPHALEFVPKCYKTQKINICDKAVDTYPSTIKFVPECYKTQKCVAEQFIVAFLYLGLFLINNKSLSIFLFWFGYKYIKIYKWKYLKHFLKQFATKSIHKNLISL